MGSANSDHAVSLKRRDAEGAGRPATWRLFALACLALVLHGDAADDALPATAPPMADGGDAVEFAGCAAVVNGPVCELDGQSPLRVWVPATRHATHAEVATDRGGSASTRTTVAGGTLLQVTVPKGATEVRVVDGERVLASLHVASAKVYGWVAEVAALRDTGKLDAAKALLDATTPRVSGAERARALGLSARNALARGELEAAVAKLYEAVALDHASGLPSAEADDSFALAFTLDQRLFRFTEARAVLARVATTMRDYPEGRARLPYYEGLVAADTNDVRGALLRFTEAEARAERLGMTRLARNARSSHAQQLANLGRYGDALAALAVLAESGGDGDPCDRIDVLDALGAWTLRAIEGAGDGSAYEAAALVAARTPPLALAHTRGTPQLTGRATPPRGEAPRPVDLADAERAFALAASLFPSACADVNRHADVLLGLADVARRRGRTREARARLAEARASVPSRTSSVELTALALDARISLDEGAPARALDAYDAAGRTAGSAGLAEWEYATALGRGEAYEAMGRLAEALTEYERAEALIDNQSVWIPFEEGRSTFLADRERCARLHIDLLLRMGRDADALARARASRNRVIGAFERTARLEGLGAEARARWESSIEAYRRIRDALERDAADAWKWSGERLAREQRELSRKNADLRAALEAAFAVIASEVPNDAPRATLSPPQPGELVLVYHPVREGWVGFAATASGVTTFHVDTPALDVAPAIQSARLLAPARDAIDGASRLRVLSYGPLRHIDFHALPWEDGVLLDRLPVTYGVDAAASSRDRDLDPRDERALSLVVADPTSDLPHALREARGVADALRRAPDASHGTVRYLVNDDADSVRVRGLLPNALLFHYAGHGRFAGRGGLESALALAEGGTLTVGDILALPRSPPLVVLSGCETGRAASDGAGVGLGLAHAFVLAGSRAVLAPVRAVEDGLAEEVTLGLYRAFEHGTREPAAALREALREIHAHAPSSDWAAFRAVTP